MKPLIQYGPAGRITKRGDHGDARQRNRVNETDEREARLREGVAMKPNEGRKPMPRMFASYGNGPFLMPTLQLPLR